MFIYWLSGSFPFCGVLCVLHRSPSSLNLADVLHSPWYDFVFPWYVSDKDYPRWSYPSAFCFMNSASAAVPIKLLPYPGSSRFYPMWSSVSYIFFYLELSILNWFSCRAYVWIHFFSCEYPVVPIWWKGYIWSIVLHLGLLSNIGWLYFLAISVLSILLQQSFCLFFYHLPPSSLDFCSFRINFKVG